jgi:hypothetical protein
VFRNDPETPVLPGKRSDVHNRGVVKLGWALVGSAMAIGLTACGSSQRHSYSIRQVESAFAAHGISLRQRERTTGEVIALAGRGGVRVLVAVREPNWSFGWTGEKPITRANLVVFRPPFDAQAVNGALHDLH